MIELRTPAEIEAMKPAGRFVAETLATLRDETKVGTNLLAIDRRAHDLIRRAGAESCYIDYHPSFGAQPVRQGHLHLRQRRRAARPPLRLRAARRRPRLARLRGVDRRLGRRLGRLVRRRHRRATRTSRSSTRPSGRWMPRSPPPSSATASATSRTRSPQIAHADGYSINTDFGGHGVGRVMHGDPHVPNDGKAGRGYPLRAGLVVALEPWFLRDHRRAHHRSGRLDAAQRRRLARRALRAHRRDHRRRPDRADGAELTGRNGYAPMPGAISGLSRDSTIVTGTVTIPSAK